MLDYLLIMIGARKARMDERGASAVEYGLLVAGITAVIILVVMALGGKIQDIFKETCSGISGGEANAPANCK
ncbi:Flp family type IVb pilin [Nocardioides sp. GXZ039]|uniref:Flp family type IVb pilin n=1 Tax=Nocardioides sp. GXZ039 TaxID=3136018 RepID=UPI0030F4B19E